MNNLENIIENGFLEFKENDFFFIQIFKRRKDHPRLEHPVVRLKSYSIYSIDELVKIMPKIIEYCDLYKARAYIRLNKQNSIDVSLRCIEQISKNIRDGNSQNNRGIWDSVSGDEGSKNYWLLDIDNEHITSTIDIVDDIKLELNNHFSNVRGTEMLFIENKTKSGIHIITKPFDGRILSKINKGFSDSGIETIKILKDCNTLLYCFE